MAATTVAAEARAPSQGSIAFTEAITRGDLGAAVDCFTRDGCLATPDSTLVRGRSDIRPILGQLIAVRSEIEIQGSLVLPAGDVALGFERWQVVSAAPEGGTFSRILDPTLVLRWVEGLWKLALVIPWPTQGPRAPAPTEGR